MTDESAAGRGTAKTLAPESPRLGPCWTCPRKATFTLTKGVVVRATCAHHLASCVRMLAEAMPAIDNCNVYVGGIRV